MLELACKTFLVTISDDPSYTVGFADNVRTYEHEYLLDCDHVNCHHAIRVTDNDDDIASCILLACGGSTCIHEHSAVTHDNSCIIAVGPFMASVALPSLQLEWATKTDWATCFGVPHSEKHECLISHVELEIARVSFAGRLIWQVSGGDIFTGGFTLHDDCVDVIDWEDREYHIDIATGRETAG